MWASDCGGFSCFRAWVLGKRVSNYGLVITGLVSHNWNLMWNLPRPGIELMPPALTGGFLTTGPPGKSHLGRFLKNIPESGLYHIRMGAGQDVFKIFPGDSVCSLGWELLVCAWKPIGSSVLMGSPVIRGSCENADSGSVGCIQQLHF